MRLFNSCFPISPVPITYKTYIHMFKACQRMYLQEAKETRSNSFIQELQAQLMELKQAHFDKERAWGNAFHEATVNLDETKATLATCEKKLSNRAGKASNNNNDESLSGSVAVFKPPSSSSSSSSGSNSISTSSASPLGIQGTATKTGAASSTTTTSHTDVGLRGGITAGVESPPKKTFKWHIEKINR
jgi:hypothetical protein